MVTMGDTTPTSEIHELQGSSLPGAGTLDSLAAAHRPGNKPRPHPRRGAPDTLSWLDEVGESDFDRSIHPEASLIEICENAADLVQKDQRAWGLVADGEFDDDDPLTSAARETSAAVRAASLDLSTRPARTPEGLAEKAAVLQDALFVAGGRFPSIDDHQELLKSVLDDARMIGSRSRFTLARLAGLEMDPPGRAPEEGWSFRHLVHDWARTELEGRAWTDIADRLEDLHPLAPMPDATLVRESDARLFKVHVPEGCHTVEGNRFYGTSDVLAALRQIAEEDSPNLSLEVNLARQARAREILDAHGKWLRDRETLKRDVGLTAARRATEWEVRKARALRHQIVATPVDTLDGLLLKALVYADCLKDSPAEAADEIEAELLEDGYECTAETVMRSMLLDLVRMVVARRMSLHSVSAQFSAEERRERAATATKSEAA